MDFQFIYWKRAEEWLRARIKGFSVKDKKYNKFQRFIGKVAFFTNYMKVFTTIYPNVWLPDRPLENQRNPNVLQHEGVHLLDQQTFFGLFPNGNTKLNSLMFYVVYFMPQVFAIFALLAFFNLWWLLCLGFLAPLPAPFRMIAEMRGYRRSLELGQDQDSIIENFTGKTYYFMWPFKRHVRKLLEKNSPYKEGMDSIYEN
jgi:hypothetical protein